MNKGNNSQALKAGVWYLICNFLLKGISFITTPIFTRLLTAEDYGITATFSSYQSIFTIIATLDLYSCIQISKQDFGNDNDKFVSSVLTLSSLTVFIVYAAVRGIKIFIPSFLDMSATMIDIMFVGILFSNAFTLMQTQHRAYFRYKQVTFFTILSTVLSVVLGMVFVMQMSDNKYMGRIVGNLLPSMAVSLFAMISIYSKGRCLFKREYWKYALVISVPLIPHHLSGNILSNFDRIMINSMCGSSQAGIYSLAYNVGAVVQLIWSSFNSAWCPWFYEQMGIDKIEPIRKAVKPYAIIFSALVFMVIALAPEIIMILGPEEYWDAKWVIPPLALGIFLQFLYSLYVNIEFFYKKTSRIAVGTVIAALLNIALNYIFIPIFGYIVAAYTTLVGYAVMFAFHYVQAKKIEKRDLYDVRFIICLITVVFIICTIVAGLYNTTIVRYIITGLLAIIVCIANRKYINMIIKRRFGR